MRSTSITVLAAVAAVAVVFGCAASPAGARPGDVLITRPGSLIGPSFILRLDPGRGTLSTVTDTAGVFPTDLTFGPEGEVYVTDLFVGAVNRIDPATGALDRIAYGGRNLIGPMGVAYAAEGRLYVADPANGYQPPSIFRIDLSSLNRTRLGLGSLLDRPTGLTIAADGDVVVSDLGPAGTESGRLILLHSGPRGDRARPLARKAGLRQPRGLATAADGSIIVADPRGPERPGRVVSVSPSGRASRTLFRSIRLSEPVDVGVAQSGAVYVLDSGGSGKEARLLRLSPDGDASTLLSGPELEGANGIAVEPPRCRGRVANVVGSDGRDRLRGSRFSDVIAGLDGNDRISGFNGDDVICGGSGDDRINGGKGYDTLLGGADADRLNGSAGDDRLHGGSSRDQCEGRGGRDVTMGCDT